MCAQRINSEGVRDPKADFGDDIIVVWVIGRNKMVIDLELCKG